MHIKIYILYYYRHLYSRVSREISLAPAANSCSRTGIYMVIIIIMCKRDGRENEAAIERDGGDGGRARIWRETRTLQ